MGKRVWASSHRSRLDAPPKYQVRQRLRYDSPGRRRETTSSANSKPWATTSPSIKCPEASSITQRTRVRRRSARAVLGWLVRAERGAPPAPRGFRSCVVMQRTESRQASDKPLNIDSNQGMHMERPADGQGPTGAPARGLPTADQGCPAVRSCDAASAVTETGAQLMVTAIVKERWRCTT